VGGLKHRGNGFDLDALVLLFRGFLGSVLGRVLLLGDRRYGEALHIDAALVEQGLLRQRPVALQSRFLGVNLVEKTYWCDWSQMYTQGNELP
jgi:hypothetical protein